MRLKQTLLLILINDKFEIFFSSNSLEAKPLIIMAHDLLRKCFTKKSMRLRVKQDGGGRKT